MYRVSVQTLVEDSQDEENVDVDVGEESNLDSEEKENEPNIQTHQIVKETEDMIEINLSHEEEEPAKKIQQCKKVLHANFERAAIDSNEQLLAANSALANGASVIYMTQVIRFKMQLNKKKDDPRTINVCI